MKFNARPAALLVLLLLLSCSRGKEVSDADKIRAHSAIGPFRSRLASALTMAVKQNPVDAIDVCSLKAPEIAASFENAGVSLGRTSDRLRNPANAPQPWVVPLLEDYVTHPDKRDPSAVYLDEGTIGYVEPITVKPLCLTCHGESITPDVSARLAALYPNDQATGYRDGEFRGLFWITMQVEEKK